MALSKEKDETKNQQKTRMPESSEPVSDVEDLVNILLDLLVDKSEQKGASEGEILGNERSPTSETEILESEAPTTEIAETHSQDEDLATALTGLQSLLFPKVEQETPVSDATPEPRDSETTALGSKEATTGLESLSNLLLGESSPVETPVAEPASEPQDSENMTTALGELSKLLGEISKVATPLEESENQVSETKPDQEDSEFELLQNLLVDPEVSKVRKLSAELDKKLSKIEEQLYNPERLINLLLPVIAELLNLKVNQSKEEITQAIAPIIDEAIQQRSQQDKKAMTKVLAALIPDAISQQIQTSPQEIAKAIAPEVASAIKEQINIDREAIANVLAPQMGEAIKEQIRIEQEAMVDALYPVIGSTVAKYIAEAIREINEKISKTLSTDGIRRKIRARLHGVSEGELIFKESIPFTIQAIFLIHKGSGLVIAEAQASGDQRLESEMVAGMLTAIRSFVNDCIAQSGELAELDDIEYGLSTIKLEVAGYCYMAVVTKGDPPKAFIEKLRKTLSTIVLHYSKIIEEFDGDPETIPEKIHALIADLADISPYQKEKTPPPAIQLLLVGAASLILIPLGIYQYHNSIDYRIEAEIAKALTSNPELAVYPLEVDAHRETLQLAGKLPNEKLRAQAEEIAKTVAPNLKLENNIIAVEVPPDPVLVADEIARVQETLNELGGISISAQYSEGKVTIEGTAVQEADAKNITQAFEKIPGVSSVVSTVQLQPLTLNTRIYFKQGSSKINPEDIDTKLIRVKRFLSRYPQIDLNIVGHSDRFGKPEINQRLALERAVGVKNALITLGIPPERLKVAANPEPPLDIEPNHPQWMSRCVILYPVLPAKAKP